mmetsp:Transcript_8379/g.20165  ORF Transcript_8379/g.20165 Transcript_8379/m.20165 type:complete len:108 (+) Transcript_8379:122-445(+)
MIALLGFGKLLSSEFLWNKIHVPALKKHCFTLAKGSLEDIKLKENIRWLLICSTRILQAWRILLSIVPMQLWTMQKDHNSVLMQSRVLEAARNSRAPDHGIYHQQQV